MEIKDMNIYQRLSAITNELGTVSKNLEVKFGQGTYKAVSEIDVLKPVKKLEEKYGIYSYPKFRQIVDKGTITNSKGTTSLYMRVETEYCFVNMDKPEEQISVITYGDGVDTQDKAPGKAMTYADKYALLKAYKIATGDDPDKDGSATDNEFDLEGIGEKKLDKNKLATITNLSIDPDEGRKVLAKYGYERSTDILVKDYAKIFKELKELV